MLKENVLLKHGLMGLILHIFAQMVFHKVVQQNVVIRSFE